MKKLFKKIVIWILTEEAKLVLKRKSPFIIAVTGNLGKTSTKDAIYAVMEDHFHVRKTEKSLNSGEFGVALTVLGEKSGWSNPLMWVKILLRGALVPFDENYPTHLVLEVGADAPGEIQGTSEWVKPDITVVTQFAEVPVHVEAFESRDHLIQEKGYMVEVLKDTGLYIYNADDHDSSGLASKTKARIMGVGITTNTDVHADGVHAYGDPIEGTRARILVAGTVHDLVLPGVLGKSPVYACLPAIAVATELNIPIELACASLRDAYKPNGRMKILHGMNNTRIIDDTYNASPKATEHGLRTLESLDIKGRKIAVLGDMLELGDFTRDEHYRIGTIAAKCAHKLVVVGIRSRFTAEGALDNHMLDQNILECDNAIEAGKELLTLLEPGDVVYVKGSQSMRMEKCVKMILEESHDPHTLLVRQEKEWLLR